MEATNPNTALKLVITSSYQLTYFMLTTCILFSWYLYFRNRKYKTTNGSMGLEAIPLLQPAYPIIGNIPLGVPFNKLFKYAERKAKSCGEIVRITAIGREVVFINSAPLLETLLKSTDHGHLGKPEIGYKLTKPFMTNGLLQSDGVYWQKQRKILMRSQKFTSLKHHMGNVCWHSLQLIYQLDQQIRKETPQPIFCFISTTLLGVIIGDNISKAHFPVFFIKLLKTFHYKLEMLTGYRGHGSQELLEFYRNFQTFIKGLTQRGGNVFIYMFWKILPISRQFYTASNKLVDFTNRRINEYKQRRNIEQQSSSDKPGVRVVLDDLMEEGCSHQQIVDEANTMLLAGHETSASLLYYFLVCISQHPEIQKKCSQEVDALISRNPNLWRDGKVSLEMVHGELKYVERCLLETLRMFPPAYQFARQIASPLDIIYNGNTVQLPAGTIIEIVPYFLHRKEEYYPNPEKFDPDRFLTEEMEKRHPYAFLPFSGGTRNCIGQKFAMLESKTFVAYLLANFEFKTMEKIDDIPIIPSVTLRHEREFTFILNKRNAIYNL